MLKITVARPCLSLVLCLSCLATRAEDWPCWRGPRGDGTSTETSVPTQWDGPAGRHIAWKVEIPGKGHASPIVAGERIFVVSCREDRQDRVLLCLDRTTGRTIWEKTVLHSPLEKRNRLNSCASSTPASDGKFVYVAFAAIDPSIRKGDTSFTTEKNVDIVDPCEMVVAAYDFEGRQQWLVRPGKFASKHGFCSPPTLFENLVIVNGDHDGDAYLVALDKATGQTVWKTPRENKTRSYCPPIIRQIDGRTQMVLSGSLCVASYDPRTRQTPLDHRRPDRAIRRLAGLQRRAAVPHRRVPRASHHGHPPRRARQRDQDPRRLAHHQRLLVCAIADRRRGRKYFLVVADNGIASCFEAASGERYWMERIGPHYSASLVEADGLVHFLSDEGITKIIRPGPKFDVVAENRLGENCYASPAISQGRIYIRAEKHLYSIKK